MNSFKMAYMLLKNNFKIYKLYLIILIVSVAIYYNFSAVEYNEIFIDLQDKLQTASIVVLISKIILVFTLIFFISHANKFFLKQRQKEIGLYMLMGISNLQIARVFAIEVLFIGCFSLVVGISIGVLFSKLFFMIMMKSIDIGAEIPFNISITAIFNVLLVFSIIFIFFSIINYRKIKNSELLHLIRMAKSKETVPKTSCFRGYLGVLFIILAYIIGIISSIDNQKIDPFIGILFTTIMTCIGTYIFYESFLSIVFCKLIKNKRFIYKETRLISSSNIFFRLKSNYRALAITTLLVASTITACGVSLSLNKYNKDDVLIQRPYSFSYVGNEIENEVDNIINESSHKIIDKNKFMFCESDVKYLKTKIEVDYNNGCIITSYSEAKKALEFSKSKEEIRTLDDDEVIFSTNSNTSGPPINVEGEEISIRDKTYEIEEERRLPITGNISDLGKKNIYIFSDKEYERIRKKSNEVILNTYKISEEDNAKELMMNIENKVQAKNIKLYPYVESFMWEHYAFGLFFFFGIVMCIIFILASFSSIYFKILEDAITDREQYNSLSKIGMSREQIKKSIRNEMAITFLLPSILGSIHGIIAMLVFQNIINKNFWIEIVVSIVIFLIIMLIYNKLICNRYFSMIKILK